ncbi:MAG: hypothetical protein ACOCRX_12090, partial [Candidatus Woesearchaeota archaeon]
AKQVIALNSVFKKADIIKKEKMQNLFIKVKTLYKDAGEAVNLKEDIKKKYFITIDNNITDQNANTVIKYLKTKEKEIKQKIG